MQVLEPARARTRWTRTFGQCRILSATWKQGDREGKAAEGYGYKPEPSVAYEATPTAASARAGARADEVDSDFGQCRILSATWKQGDREGKAAEGYGYKPEPSVAYEATPTAASARAGARADEVDSDLGSAASSRPRGSRGTARARQPRGTGTSPSRSSPMRRHRRPQALEPARADEVDSDFGQCRILSATWKQGDREGKAAEGYGYKPEPSVAYEATPTAASARAGARADEVDSDLGSAASSRPRGSRGTARARQPRGTGTSPSRPQRMERAFHKPTHRAGFQVVSHEGAHPLASAGCQRAPLHPRGHTSLGSSLALGPRLVACDAQRFCLPRRSSWDAHCGRA